MTSESRAEPLLVFYRPLAFSSIPPLIVLSSGSLQSPPGRVNDGTEGGEGTETPRDRREHGERRTVNDEDDK